MNVQVQHLIHYSEQYVIHNVSFLIKNQVENYPCQIYNGGFVNVGENAYVNQHIVLQFI